MATIIKRVPIDRLYVWAGLMWLIGLSISVSSAMSIFSGDGRTYNWLMLIAGVSLVFGMGWEAYHRDPAEFSMNGYWLGFLAICTLLAVGGSVMIVVGLL